MSTFYFAYGANTHKLHMAQRCPAAVPLGRVKLFGHALAFRGVADLIKAPGRKVVGALWQITEACERSLDAFEGFPRLYVKRTSHLKLHGKIVKVMFYVMRQNDDRFSAPPMSYEQVLRAGYEHFGIKHEQIDAAISHAMQSNSPPPFVSKWHRIDYDGQNTGRTRAKMRAKPEAREPAPSKKQRDFWDSFDERLRAARLRPEPTPEPTAPTASGVRMIARAGREPLIELSNGWRGSYTDWQSMTRRGR